MIKVKNIFVRQYFENIHKGLMKKWITVQRLVSKYLYNLFQSMLPIDLKPPIQLLKKIKVKLHLRKCSCYLPSAQRRYKRGK